MIYGAIQTSDRDYRQTPAPGNEVTLSIWDAHPLAKEYTKLDPQVLLIASSLMAGQRPGHHFLSSHHAAAVSKTNATIYDLRDVVNIDSWPRTARFPYETMRSAPDTSFDESGTPGRAPSYQWYTKIEVACQNFRNALVDERKCNEELDW